MQCDEMLSEFLGSVEIEDDKGLDLFFGNLELQSVLTLEVSNVWGVIWSLY